MTPLGLADIRDTLAENNDRMTAAVIRDLDWMIADGYQVALAPARLAGKEPAPTFDPDIWRRGEAALPVPALDALREALEAVLADEPVLYPNSPGGRWYSEGWNRCARDVRAALREGETAND